MRRFILSSLALALLAFVLAPGARAQRTTIEAENYTSYSDAGGVQIQPIALSGCSNGYFLFGLDTPGEWTQYDFTANAAGVYSLGLKCRGTLNRGYSFRAVFTPVAGGSAQTVDFNFTGEGFG